MTTPHGYPDYQGFPNAATPNLFPSFMQVVPPGPLDTPVIAVANWQSILVSADASAGYGGINISHYADAAGTQLIGIDGWPISMQISLKVQSPLRGAFVKLTTTALSPGPMTCTTFAALQATPADRITFPVGYQHVQATGRVIPASVTDTYVVSHILAGRAAFMFNPHDNAAQLFPSLRIIEASGALDEYIYRPPPPAAQIYQLLEVPDNALEVFVVNNDAAGSHTYDMSLVIPPQ